MEQFAIERSCSRLVRRGLGGAGIESERGLRDVQEGSAGTFQKSKRVKNKIDKPFKPVRVRTRRKPPSKTKVSQLYARIKNLERQRAEGRKDIRGLKPRRHYEKKLFKPDEKPK